MLFGLGGVLAAFREALSAALRSPRNTARIDHTGHEARIWWGLRVVRHRLHYRLLSASYQSLPVTISSVRKTRYFVGLTPTVVCGGVDTRAPRTNQCLRRSLEQALHTDGATRGNKSVHRNSAGGGRRAYLLLRLCDGLLDDGSRCRVSRAL